MRGDLIPKVIFKLAGIQKNTDAKFEDLTKEEQKKLFVAWDKTDKAIYSNLTFFPSHNMIHVQKSDRCYFYKISDTDRYVIYDKIGDLPDKNELYFVLYRKSNGWLRSATLIGYLLKRKQFLGSEEEVTPQFKFPETLIKRRFFTKGLQKQYHLKEDIVADYISKDELGYDRGIYALSYQTDNKDDPNFWFQID